MLLTEPVVGSNVLTDWESLSGANWPACEPLPLLNLGTRGCSPLVCGLWPVGVWWRWYRLGSFGVWARRYPAHTEAQSRESQSHQCAAVGWSSQSAVRASSPGTCGDCLPARGCSCAGRTSWEAWDVALFRVTRHAAPLFALAPASLRLQF